MLAAVAFGLALPAVTEANIAPVRFRYLVAHTPLIAKVRGDTVVPVSRGRFATATVLQVLKGPRLRKIWILADPHFICDASTVVAGETALMFLDVHAAPIPADVDASIPKGGIALAIAYFGRGRMPIRDDAGKRYVDFYAGDVLLPADMPSVPTPLSGELEQLRTELKVSTKVTERLLRSAELKVVEKVIRQLTRPSQRGGNRVQKPSP